jgi:hypothetical protein
MKNTPPWARKRKQTQCKPTYHPERNDLEIMKTFSDFFLINKKILFIAQKATDTYKITQKTPTMVLREQPQKQNKHYTKQQTKQHKHRSRSWRSSCK